MTTLADKTCVPCRGDTPSLRGARLQKLSHQVPEWDVIAEHHLRRVLRFANFREALEFVNRVGELAEAQGHHPDISFGWGKAELTIYTHAIDGITESDFILAAKIDRL